MTKIFICVEQSADGPRQFAIESEKAFDALTELSSRGFDEAEVWGGFAFDIDPEDEEYSDSDGENLDPKTIDPESVITLAQIEAAIANIEDVDEDEDEDEEAYEDAYTSVRYG